MADKYTKNPGKNILVTRIMSEFNADPDIAAVPAKIVKAEFKPDQDELKIEFDVDIGDSTPAEVAIDTVITAHDSSPIPQDGVLTYTHSAHGVIDFPKMCESHTWRIAITGNTEVWGIKHGSTIKEVLILNLEAGADLKLMAEHASADPQDRIAFATTFKGGVGRQLWYDETTQRWFSY